MKTLRLLKDGCTTQDFNTIFCQAAENGDITDATPAICVLLRPRAYINALDSHILDYKDGLPYMKYGEYRIHIALDVHDADGTPTQEAPSVQIFD